MSAYPDPSQGQQGYGQPAYGQPAYGQPAYPGAKSKTTAALLAFFLGWSGAHNFYMGWGNEKKKGIAHIVLFVLGLVIYIAGIAAFAGSIETDAYGNTTSASAGGLGFGVFGLVLLWVNGIWAFVEFIMVLVKKDPRLV